MLSPMLRIRIEELSNTFHFLYNIHTQVNNFSNISSLDCGRAGKLNGYGPAS